MRISCAAYLNRVNCQQITLKQTLKQSCIERTVVRHGTQAQHDRAEQNEQRCCFSADEATRLALLQSEHVRRTLA